MGWVDSVPRLNDLSFLPMYSSRCRKRLVYLQIWWKSVCLYINAEAKCFWDGFRGRVQLFEHVIMSHSESNQSSANVFTIIYIVALDVTV